jgi:hypothetical protein
MKRRPSGQNLRVPQGAAQGVHRRGAPPSYTRERPLPLCTSPSPLNSAPSFLCLKALKDFGLMGSTY